MQMGEDHLLATYASVQLTPIDQAPLGGAALDGAPLPRLTVTKCPRFITFAPWIAAEVARRREGDESARLGPSTVTLTQLVGEQARRIAEAEAEAEEEGAGEGEDSEWMSE